MDALVYVYGTHSRVHVAVQHVDGLLTNERCNIDELAHGERHVVDKLEDVPPGHERCRTCFVSDLIQGVGDPETVTLA